MANFESCAHSTETSTLVGEAYEITASNTCDMAVETVEWFLSHIRELSTQQAGARQLKYIEKELVLRLKKYRSAVEKNLSSRTCQLTWSGCSDTMYLP